jgi:PAS domain S-box-containing protein
MKNNDQKGDPRIEALLMYADNIIATLREAFLVLDKNLKVISTNQAFYDTFKAGEKDTIGRPLPELGDGQWNIPKLLELLKDIIPEKKLMKDYEVEQKFEGIGERSMMLNASQVRVPGEIARGIATGIQEELILLAIEDITERKRFQRELKESEQRYRRAFETSRDGLLLVHKTRGDILNSNGSARELLGYSGEELLKNKLWDIGVTRSYEDFKNMVSGLEIDGVIQYKGISVKTQKGMSVTSDVFLVDKAKDIQCNIRDITERKEREDLINKGKENYKTFFDSANDAIFVADPETRELVNCNKKAESITGRTRAEILSMRADQLHPEDVVKETMDTFKKQVEKEDIIQETIVLAKDGKRVPVSISTALTYIDGKRYLIGIFRDISREKKVAALLFQNEQKFKALFLESPVSIILHDAETGEIVDANPAAYKAYGFSSLEELKANHIWLDPPYSVKEALEWIHKAAAEGKCCFEWMSQKVTGEIFWEYVCLRKVKSDNIERVLATCVDITENKKLEEETRKQIHDLEVFHKASIGREERILELKKEIETLKKEIGK